MTELSRTYLPAMGKHWLLPLYDPLTRIIGVGRVHAQLIDRADVRPGRRILEIGAGTGNLLRALGRRHPGVEAVGIDPDPAALRRARRKATPQITYQQAYAGELPLPDDSFDRVLSALMLHHLPVDERARALREVRRVLRPGGELHVIDVHSARLPETDPARVLAAMTEAGLHDAAVDGRERARFGRVIYYRAIAP